LAALGVEALATLEVPDAFEELVVLVDFFGAFVLLVLVLFGLAVLLVVAVCPALGAGAVVGACAANETAANARAMANSVFFIFFFLLCGPHRPLTVPCWGKREKSTIAAAGYFRHRIQGGNG
jgi:hypothetical protein